MSLRRQEKLSAIYKKAANNFLQREINIEGVILSLTRVELSDKSDFLKIYFSVWPDQKEKDVLKFLEGSKKELRRELAEEIKTKFVPEIEFLLDESERKRLHIEELLKKVK